MGGLRRLGWSKCEHEIARAVGVEEGFTIVKPCLHAAPAPLCVLC